MRPDIRAALAHGELILSDGSMGAMLDRAGLPPGTLPEAWNLTRPEQVAAIYRAYRQAGARILTTNTIGGNRPRLAAAGLDSQTAEINRRRPGP
jgi:methionine synthase I (cobalamin-dependent)